jgi:hypothetical protein
MQRLTQVMTRGGEEFRLGDVGALRFVALHAQLLHELDVLEAQAQ